MCVRVRFACRVGDCVLNFCMHTTPHTHTNAHTHTPRLQALKDLLIAGEFCDVRFVCEDGAVHDAHRSIICARLDANSPLRNALLKPASEATR
jgi:hypothetical protein